MIPKLKKRAIQTWQTFAAIGAQASHSIFAG